MEEVLDHIYRIPVPLPGNPLRELNAYLIQGTDRNVLIDTGFCQEPCRQALFAGLEELGARLEDTDVLLTHLHSDHSGLGPEVTRFGRSIFISAVDQPMLDIQGDHQAFWRKSDLRFVAEGFPQPLVDTIHETNPARSMAPPEGGRYVGLQDDDIVEVGGYRLRCVLTPGHTPGQMCFWLEREGAMFLGDHVLFDITPNITTWPGVSDSLGDYLDSLRAIQAYDVALPLPGHRGRGDFKPRIDALLNHHRCRLDEALQAVKEHPGLPAYDLAGFMTWKIRADSWDTFPLTQKWFAVGECMSHLNYLRTRDFIRFETDSAGIHRYFAV